VVIPADDLLLAAHVRVPKDREQHIPQSLAFERLHSGWRRDVWRAPGGRQPAAGQPAVQEGHGDVRHRLITIIEVQAAVARKGAYDGHLDGIPRADGAQPNLVLRRHGQHHALLGLGEPDLPRLQADVLERHILQRDAHSRLLAHLADGRGEPAGAAIGDCRV